MNPNILGLMKYIDAKNEINPLINTSDMIYKITAKDFPYIEIISKLYISIFSGSKQVILKDDKKTYELQRECMDNSTRFFYECNKEGDYIPDVQDGHLYSLDELKSLAEKLIDLILKAENDLFRECLI